MRSYSDMGPNSVDTWIMMMEQLANTLKKLRSDATVLRVRT